MGGRSSEEDESAAGDRRGDGAGVARPAAGVELLPLSSLESEEPLLTPLDLTALANSLTILFVPGTFKLVPTTNNRSAPLLPLPLLDPIKSFWTTSPTPSPSLCASL